ncbi:DUF6412 domain-containing protein [Curtobacterium aetherium]|uniref:DUF6412 domain-containing protein n=1 Tax=Curtobacterium aetherium TaxID=2841594 RepID=UPI003B5181C3
MTVIEVLLRVVAALHALDPGAIGGLPGLTVAALGIGVLGVTVAGSAALAAALVVLRLVALLTGAARVPRAGTTTASPDLVTRIAWSDPDAPGHARPRAPGVVPAV